MNRFHIPFVATLLSAVASAPAATLINIQLNGLTTAYSGAAQLGSTGDTWNNPTLTNMDNDNVVHTGTETLASGAALVDSTGAATGATLGMAATHYKSDHAAISDGNPTSGLTDRALKFDWAGDSPVPSWEMTLSGLAANTAANVYVYGGAGSVLSLNGGTETKYQNDGSANRNDAADAGNQGICWELLSGTTDGSGNLTIDGRGGDPELTIWWQTYLSGVQVEVVPEPGGIMLLGMGLAGLLMRRRQGRLTKNQNSQQEGKAARLPSLPASAESGGARPDLRHPFARRQGIETQRPQPPAAPAAPEQFHTLPFIVKSMQEHAFRAFCFPPNLTRFCP